MAKLTYQKQQETQTKSRNESGGRKKHNTKCRIHKTESRNDTRGQKNPNPERDAILKLTLKLTLHLRTKAPSACPDFVEMNWCVSVNFDDFSIPLDVDFSKRKCSLYE